MIIIYCSNDSLSRHGRSAQAFKSPTTALVALSKSQTLWISGNEVQKVLTHPVYMIIATTQSSCCFFLKMMSTYFFCESTSIVEYPGMGRRDPDDQLS